MQVSRALLKILVCPVTKARLLYDKETDELVSPEAALAYPIIDGIPILLTDEAKTVTTTRIQKLLQEQKVSNDEDVLENCY